VKTLPSTSLALVLALSGYSSWPSIEEKPLEQETKLIGYELCLDTAKDFYTKQFEGSGATPDLIEGLAFENGKDKRP
jgi:hypothetical protein